MTGSHPHPEQLPLPPILPVGTKVVTRVEAAGHAAGAVGIIVQSPVDAQHAYRVRFMDAAEGSLRREELVVLRHYQRESGEVVDSAAPEYDFKRHVILRCVIGSRAYGLDH